MYKLSFKYFSLNVGFLCYCNQYKLNICLLNTKVGTKKV